MNDCPFSKTPQELNGIRNYAKTLAKVIESHGEFKIVSVARGYMAALQRYRDAERVVYEAAARADLTEAQVTEMVDSFRLYRARIMLDISTPELEEAIELMQAKERSQG